MSMVRNWWVSWYSTPEMGAWELASPWWKSGERGDGAATVCAAIRALDASDARRKVAAAYDIPLTNPLIEIEWRFVNQRDDDWSPFNSRFPRAEWMQWP